MNYENFILLCYIVLFSIYIALYRNKEFSKSKTNSTKSKTSKDLKNIKYFSYLIWSIAFSIILLKTKFSIQFFSLFPDSLFFELSGIFFSITGTLLFAWAKLTLAECFSPCSNVIVPKYIKTSGPYSEIRHPIYSGNLIFVFGVFLFTNSILVLFLLLILTKIYLTSIKYEEETLENSIPEYMSYKTKTGMLLPTRSFLTPRLKFYQISNLEELRDFQLKFNESGGVEVDDNYLLNSKVFGFFDRKNHKLHAGYIVNDSSTNLRYLNLIPNDVQKNLDFLKNKSELCEITCIWMSKTQKLSKYEKFFVYLFSLIDAILTGKKYVLGGTNNPKILAIQSKILPNPLWSGIKHNANYKVWVYYGRSIFLIPRILFVGLPSELVRRKILEQKRKKQELSHSLNSFSTNG